MCFPPPYPPRQQQDIFVQITCKIRSQILFFKSFFSTHSLFVKNVARLALDLFLKFVYPFLLFGANLVSNWFRLHQKVLALIYYIRKLFTPLKNPAFTANVHSPPIFTEIQRCESEKIEKEKVKILLF